MGLFAKFKAGLQKTQSKLAHEIKRIVTRSPKLEGATIEELEAALIAADLGMAMTSQIVEAVKKSYETQAKATTCPRHRTQLKWRRASARTNPTGSAVAPGGLTGCLDCRRQWNGQDHHVREARALYPISKQNRACSRRAIHVSRGGYRANQALG